MCASARLVCVRQVIGWCVCVSAGRKRGTSYSSSTLSEKGKKSRVPANLKSSDDASQHPVVPVKGSQYGACKLNLIDTEQATNQPDSRQNNACMKQNNYRVVETMKMYLVLLGTN